MAYLFLLVIEVKFMADSTSMMANPYALLMLLGVFAITYYLIIRKSFDKTLAAMLGALVALLVASITGVVTQGQLFAVDLGHDYLILGVLLGNLLIVAVASDVGLFQFVSIKLLKFTKGAPRKLYWVLGLLTFLLSATVNTIPAILVVGALTLVATRELNYNPKPYILMEIVITNTGGLTTIISAITNLIIATPFKISFVQFAMIASPLAVVLFVVSMLCMSKLSPYDKIDAETLAMKQKDILSYNEWAIIKNQRRFKLTALVFALTMLLLLLSDTLGIEIAVVAVGGGVCMMLTADSNLDNILQKMDWALLGFFLSLFVLIKALELAGLLTYLTQFLLIFLGGTPIVSALVVLGFSSILSGILDNVVLAVAITPVLLDIGINNPKLHIGSMVWALIIGTNLGGGLTPIGAPPGVLGLGILKKETGTLVGWGEFFKTVGIVTILRILLSTIFLAIIVFFDSSALIGPFN